MAEQEEPVRRRVALKVIKLGMDTKSVVARFEAERQALALMDHPNIAKVLEAGATDTGRPYFVMELVRGIKITDYCDENNLSTSARLELFIQVCQAIQHAHQKGIIHRDIKPSNILVADHDGTPVPKIIDFGIAKATTDQRLTDKTLFTAFEQFIGTPAYMSPEQAKLSGLDIDTRSDIYSLGVLLYELLAGSTPFDAKELMSSGLDAMRKIIREQEPVRPSTRFATLQAADLTTTAKRRSTDTSKLLHQLRGDLDWIVMKCLEKDRTRRYETANGLAMNIQRHLQNELVLARPPSVGYKFQRLVRRNKLAFTALAAVTAALIIGLGVATWSFFIEQRALRQAEAERKTAKTEAAKATAISDFFQQSLQAANPDESKSSDYTVRQLLDDYSTGLEGRFTNQPAVEAAVRVTIGKAYYRLGAGDKAQPHLERALVLNRQLYGEHEQVAATLADCAWASFEQKEYAKAEQQARAALEIYRKDGTAGQPVLFALRALQESLNQQYRLADSIAVGEQALDMARKTPNMEYPETASILHGLAESKIGQSKFPEAEVLARQAVEMHRRLQGSQHPETGWALTALGQALGAQNKLDEAERADREALNIFRRQFLSGNKGVDNATYFLRAVLEAKGDLPGLVRIDQITLADQRSIFGENSPAVAETLNSLASHLQLEGKQAEAGKALHEALDIELKLIGPDSTNLPALLRQEAQTLDRLAGILQHEGNLSASEQAYRDALALEGKLPGEEAAFAASASALADLLRRNGKIAEAGALAREAAQKCHGSMAQYEKLASDSNRQNESWSFAISYEAIGEILNQTGQTQEAEKAYLDAQVLWRKLVANFDWEDRRFHLAVNYDALGNVQREVGRAAEALASYQAAQPIWAKLAADSSTEDHRMHLGWTDENIGQLLKESGRFDEAAEVYWQAIALYEKASADFPNEALFTERLGTVKERLAELLNQRGNILRQKGQHEQAEQVLSDTVKVFEKAVQEYPAEPFMRQEQAFSRRLHGDVLEQLGRVAEGESEYRAAIALYVGLKASVPTNSFYREEEGYTTWMLAEMLQRANLLDAAEAEYRQAIALHEKASADFPNEKVLTERLGTIKVLLAELLSQLGRLPEARPIYQETAERGSASDQNELAWFFATSADPKFRDGTNAVAFAEKAVAATNRKNTSYLDTLAAAYAETGQFAKAVTIQQEAIALSQGEDEKKDLASRLKLYESHSPFREDGALAMLANARLSEGKFAEAEGPARECLTIREIQIPDDWRTFNARSMLGGSLLGQKNYAEAEPLLLSGYEGMKQREVKIPPEGKVRLNETLQRLAQLYEATKRPDQAVEWRKKLAELETDKK
jgi:serine/threonine protein kinase